MTPQTEEQTTTAITAAIKEEPFSIEEATKKIKIWSLTNRIRTATFKRLNKALLEVSPYGRIRIQVGEAMDIAVRVEAAAFTAVGGSFRPPAGIAILEVYIEEIIKSIMVMIEAHIVDEEVDGARVFLLERKKERLEELIRFF